MTAIQRSPALSSAVLITLVMIVTVGTALGFEHLGGYIPCALCLMQREPYYYGIPVGVLAIISAAFPMPAWLPRLLLAVVAIMMLVGAGIGIYHAGVEWHFWEGPSSCATSAQGVSANVGDLLGDLDSKHGPSCTDAALRVLGLSFAGWNVLASLVLAALAVRGAVKAR
ncbi:disulfide bond formation protein DsbB [Rhizobium sp. PP-F2F-G36]|nr:disulfide bond formation protein DsbB [Rhizobium sp. PP-F2F-G36]